MVNTSFLLDGWKNNPEAFARSSAQIGTVIPRRTEPVKFTCKECGVSVLPQMTKCPDCRAFLQVWDMQNNGYAKQAKVRRDLRDVKQAG